MTSPSSGSPARARLWRVLLAWSVGLVLLGDVWHLPHLLLVRHVVCGEHGELVHQHEGVGTSQAAAHVDPGVRVGPGEPLLHAHQHCSAVTTSARDAAVLVEAPRPVAVIAPVLPLTQVAAAHEAQLPLGVLTYAPKHGPPARA